MHAFDKFAKFDHTTNNMIETWNAWLSKIREAPIMALVEHVTKQMMKAISERRQTCLKWPTIVPAFINKKMNKILKVGRNYHVIPASDALYELKLAKSPVLLILISIHVIVGCARSMAYLVSI